MSSDVQIKYAEIREGGSGHQKTIHVLARWLGVDPGTVRRTLDRADGLDARDAGVTVPRRQRR